MEDIKPEGTKTEGWTQERWAMEKRKRERVSMAWCKQVEEAWRELDTACRATRAPGVERRQVEAHVAYQAKLAALEVVKAEAQKARSAWREAVAQEEKAGSG